MRVAHIVGAFSKLSETFIYDLVVESKRQGIDAHVITSEHVNMTDRPFEAVHVFSIASLSTGQAELHASPASFSRIPRDPEDIPLVREHYQRIIEKLAPDMIHAHFGELGWQVAPIATTLNIPLIVSFHGYDVTRLPREPRWQERYAELFQTMKVAIVVSNTMRDLLIGLGVAPEKIHIIHVGKKLASYSLKKVLNPVCKWISVGRLVEKKGHEDTIRAFAQSLAYTPSSLTIIGEGEEKARLQALIQELHCEEYIHLLGPMPHEKVVELMADSDAFILCSKTARNGDTEGVSTVLMEAQLIGLPCVSTLHSGIPEAFPPENHWMLAPEGDIAAIEKSIRQVQSLTASELKTVVERGRNHVTQHFSLDTTAGMHVELYSTLLG